MAEGLPRSRVSIQSYTRPLRQVVMLREPISPQAFRLAVGRLCSVWGGTKSLILPSHPDQLIDHRWGEALDAFDPDVLLLARGLGGVKRRRQLRFALSRRGLSPFWIADYNEWMGNSPRWTPVPVPLGEPRAFALGPSAPLWPSNPVQVAALGLRLDGQRAKARPSISNLPLSSLAAGTPAWESAQLIPEFPTRANLYAPFVYHTRSDTDAALWLWNLRAMRGPLFHGGDAELERHLRVIPSARARLSQIVELDPLSPAAEAFLASRALVPRRIKPNQLVLSPPRRRLPGGFDRELDSAEVTDGQFEMALRTPPLPQSSMAIASRRREGAYAIELELAPDEALPGRITVPARSEMLDLFVRSSEGIAPQIIRSRSQRQGEITLGIAPFQRRRTLALTLPTITQVLNAAAPDLRFQLSDKGRYGRWVARQAKGLAEVHDWLTDARSRAILTALRLAPADRATQRKFLTQLEMVEILKTARSSGLLGNSRRRSHKDEEWLEHWVDDHVAKELLRCGVRVRCADCLAKPFLSLGNIGRDFQCTRCGKTSSTPARPELGYQLAEVAHLFLDNDCDITARALAALSRRSRGGYTYDFDHHLTWPGAAKPREIDFAGTLDGQLFLGESKKVGNFDDSDLGLLKRLALRLRAGMIVLATGRECSGGCSPACIHDATQILASSDTSLTGPRQTLVAKLRDDLRKSGCRVIVLCGGELEGPIFV